MQMMPISGNGVRPSFFGFNADQGRNFHSMKGLGQSSRNFYDRAKLDVPKFDALVNRTARIANQTVRNNIITAYGLSDPANKAKARYTRDAVAYDIGQAEKFLPAGVSYEEGFGDSGPARGRVEKLESYNGSFERDVASAESVYGILPEPVVIERTTTITTPGATNWTLPLVVAGGAIGVAILVSAFSGK